MIDGTSRGAVGTDSNNVNERATDNDEDTCTAATNDIHVTTYTYPTPV